jgi:hypothetical protein
MKRNIFVHFCPMASGIFCDTPGSDPAGDKFSGARSPVCQNAAMELLARVPLFLNDLPVKSRKK